MKKIIAILLIFILVLVIGCSQLPIDKDEPAQMQAKCRWIFKLKDDSYFDLIQGTIDLNKTLITSYSGDSDGDSFKFNSFPLSNGYYLSDMQVCSKLYITDLFVLLKLNYDEYSPNTDKIINEGHHTECLERDSDGKCVDYKSELNMDFIVMDPFEELYLVEEIPGDIVEVRKDLSPFKEYNEIKNSQISAKKRGEMLGKISNKYTLQSYENGDITLDEYLYWTFGGFEKIFNPIIEDGKLGDVCEKLISSSQEQKPSIPDPKPDQNICSVQEGTVCQEYEVCDGEVLSVSDTSRCCKGECRLPKEFDWRNKHGENWLTSVKDQGSSNTCELFSIIGAIESHINLYYNQHLDIDLSEKHFFDCKDNYMWYVPGCSDDQDPLSCLNINNIYCGISKEGLVDEACKPFVAEDTLDENGEPLLLGECNPELLCSDWEDRLWKIDSAFKYLYATSGRDCPENEIDAQREEDIKRAIIQLGPLKTRAHGEIVFPDDQISRMSGHAMPLVGYKQIGDDLFWIFKHSGGTDAVNSEQGYLIIKVDFENMQNWVAIKGPVTPPTEQSYEINCVDKDNDGYCNWGISENKPLTCPKSCKDEKDWDDSNPQIKALGFY